MAGHPMPTEHFIPGKDASLEQLISSMQAKLAARGFDVKECSRLNPVDSVWSVHVRLSPNCFRAVPSRRSTASRRPASISTRWPARRISRSILSIRAASRIGISSMKCRISTSSTGISTTSNKAAPATTTPGWPNASALVGLFGDETLDLASDLIDGEIRFFGLASPGPDLAGCELHQRLLQEYTKVHASTAG